jgi:type III restriction enzyme
VAAYKRAWSRGTRLNFFEHPIINSPYRYPSRYWELDGNGQPTNTIIDQRRDCRLVSPVPPAKKSKAKKSAKQETMDFSTDGSSDPLDEYDPTSIVNEIRGQVDAWRKLPSPSQWGVTPETARLLQHWRSHEFHGVRPFFCQVEAVETAIWLAEVADPKRSRLGQRVWAHLDSVRESFNPELMRIALKLATGAGKTTVMAMLIAWQTINAVRHPDGKRYARGFLIVAPGITIKDRLRVLLPSDPDSYYRTREIVPPDMLPEIGKAKIVITNYHAFKLRERLSLPRTSRALLKGRGPELQTIETEGQMLQRVMSELMAFKNIVVLNDEAHHCYRQRQSGDDLKGDDREEAERNNEAARLWITGIATVKRKLGVRAVYDLSATPFFL